MKKLLLVITLLTSSLLTIAQNYKLVHPEVYQTNLAQRYIDKDGTPLLYKTSHPEIFRGTYLEYSSGRVEAATQYRIVTATGDINIVYRHPLGSSSFVQMFTFPELDSSVKFFKLEHDKKTEVTTHRLTFGLYRYGDWLQLLYVKGANGKLFYRL